MKFIGNIIEKLSISKDSVNRQHAETLIDRLNTPGLERVVISESEALRLRQHLAERLGRELRDTPLPNSYNNVEIIVDPKK